jgi:hypothetical protein
VLGDGEGVCAFRLAVPSRHTRKAVGDVLDFDVERRGVEKIQPPSAQHALPGTRLCVCFVWHGSPDVGSGAVYLNIRFTRHDLPFAIRFLLQFESNFQKMPGCINRLVGKI